MRFVHDATAARVIFGIGEVTNIRSELARLGSRPLVVCDEVAARIASSVLDDVAPMAADVIDNPRQHVPIEDAVAARVVAGKSGADCLLAIGGGSTIGLAKAVALTEGLPILAVPTTYAGSEMTPVWGLTEDGVKTTGRNPAVAPKTVIYDPQLTVSLPSAITGASGLNAIAHSVDALWASGRSPLTDVMAERSIALLARSLPIAVHNGRDLVAREQAFTGAWLAGATFGIAGSSLHHKLCHVLGGRFDLPHADTHAVVLPWAVRLAAIHSPDAGGIVGRALGVVDPVQGLIELSAELGVARTLSELGLSIDDALAVADELDPGDLALRFDVSRQELRELLAGATTGDHSRA